MNFLIPVHCILCSGILYEVNLPAIIVVYEVAFAACTNCTLFSQSFPSLTERLTVPLTVADWRSHSLFPAWGSLKSNRTISTPVSSNKVGIDNNVVVPK